MCTKALLQGTCCGQKGLRFPALGGTDSSAGVGQRDLSPGHTELPLHPQEPDQTQGHTPKPGTCPKYWSSSQIQAHPKPRDTSQIAHPKPRDTSQTQGHIPITRAHPKSRDTSQILELIPNPEDTSQAHILPSWGGVLAPQAASQVTSPLSTLLCFAG